MFFLPGGNQAFVRFRFGTIGIFSEHPEACLSPRDECARRARSSEARYRMLHFGEVGIPRCKRNRGSFQTLPSTVELWQRARDAVHSKSQGNRVEVHLCDNRSSPSSVDKICQICAGGKRPAHGSAASISGFVGASMAEPVAELIAPVLRTFELALVLMQIGSGRAN